VRSLIHGLLVTLIAVALNVSLGSQPRIEALNGTLDLDW
jgi:hypothetical protein